MDNQLRPALRWLASCSHIKKFKSMLMNKRKNDSFKPQASHYQRMQKGVGLAKADFLSSWYLPSLDACFGLPCITKQLDFANHINHHTLNPSSSCRRSPNCRSPTSTLISSYSELIVEDASPHRNTWRRYLEFHAYHILLLTYLDGIHIDMNHLKKGEVK